MECLITSITSLDAYWDPEVVQQQCPDLVRSVLATLQLILGSLPRFWQALFEVRSPLLDSKPEARPPSKYWSLLHVRLVETAHISMTCSKALA